MNSENQRFCRFCATMQPENDILVLEVNSDDYKEIEEKLVFFKADYVDLSHKLPLAICITCDTALDDAYEFMVKVKKSQTNVLDISYQGSIVSVVKAETVLENEENDDVKPEKSSDEDSRREDSFAADEVETSSIKSISHDMTEGPNLMNGYSSPMILEETVEVKSWSSYTWCCAKCDEVFTDVQVLREHSENTHNCCAKFKCADCDVLYGAFEEFVSHVRGHWECLRNYCEICDFCYDNGQLADHIATHLEYPCQHCGQLYSSLTELKEHEDKYGRKVEEVTKEVDNDNEDEAENIRNQVENTDDGETRSWIDYPWSCAVCTQTFDSVGDLRKHSEDDHGTCFSMKCADCDVTQSFPSYNLFIRHVVSHRLYLRNHCKYCNSRFENISQPEHLVTHDKHYICKRCGTLFDTLDEYNCHATKLNLRLKTTKRKELTLPPRPLAATEVSVADKSWSGYPWTCRLCDVTAKDLDALRAHSKEVHKTCFTIKCADCERLVESFQDFVVHAKLHRRFLRKRCVFCDVKFAPNLKEPDHIKTHFPDTKQLCQGCGEILENLDDLIAHFTVYNSPKATRQPTLRHKTDMTMTCRQCNKVATSLNKFRKHWETHNSDFKAHCCEVCGQSFRTKVSLDIHLPNHSNSELLICDLCGSSFRTKLRLRIHMKIHYMKKLFSCSVCHQRFRDKYALKNHLAVHSTETPFVCQFCDKAFKRRGYLRTHLHQHTGARPYICKDCGMSFTNWGNCNKHTLRRHGKKKSFFKE